MHIVFLGTGGYRPNERRHTTCFMLPQIGVVFDAGTGLFRIGAHLMTDSLDIFLTHAHLDHIVGLTYLLDVVPDRAMHRVRVHGLADKLAAVRTHLFARDLFPVDPPYEEVPLTGPVQLPGGAVATYFHLEHPGGSLAYRLDWPDRSLAVVTDTMAAPEAPYVEFVRGVNLLVHECYFPDGCDAEARLTGHSCLGAVVDVARRAGAGRLALVHMCPSAEGDQPPGLDMACQVFAETLVATDHMQLEF